MMMSLLLVLILTTVVLLLLLASSSSSSMAMAAAAAAADDDNNNNNNNNNMPPSSRNPPDMVVAIEEMQRANYLGYVMLINMAPAEVFEVGNVTFLMPNDRTLSRNMMMPPGDSVADFLLRHSIPSPLLFEHLEHFPTGSMLPTSKPDLFLRITNNNGRRSFFLNNARIISPNICTRGSSIRCHGIDQLIQYSVLTAAPPPPTTGCYNNNNNTTPPPPPAPDSNTTTPSTTTTAPPPSSSSSSSAAANNATLSAFMTAFLTLLVVKLCA